MTATADTGALEGAVERRPESRPQQQDSIGSWMEANKGQIARALGNVAEADKFAQFALTAIRGNPALQQCTPVSMLSALLVCAQVGLEPGPFGYVYLTPRWNGRLRANEVQLSIGYKGLVVLALRSSQVRKVIAHVVYEKDELAVEYGTEERIVHRPNLSGDRGPVVGAYAVAELTTGAKVFAYLTLADIEKRRAAAGKAAESGPWKTHFEQMARKSAVRDLANFLPLTAEVQQAVALDDQVQEGTGPLHERRPKDFDGAAFQEGMRELPPSTDHPAPLPGDASEAGPDDAVVPPEDAPSPPASRPATARRGGRPAPASSEAPGGAGEPSEGSVWPAVTPPGGAA